MTSLARTIRSRRAQRSGQTGQTIVATLMRQLGFRCVEEIHTGMRRVGDRYVHCKRVSGDIRAVGEKGVSVLVEVKWRKKTTTLPYGALEDHQRRALNAHLDAGGWTLLAWVSDYGVAVMYWGLASQHLRQPRDSISWINALKISYHVSTTTPE